MGKDKDKHKPGHDDKGLFSHLAHGLGQGQGHGHGHGGYPPQGNPPTGYPGAPHGASHSGHGGLGGMIAGGASAAMGAHHLAHGSHGGGHGGSPLGPRFSWWRPFCTSRKVQTSWWEIQAREV
ncbi:glycine-rich protein A3-like [Hibiscus syriacus]|uniref:glycine-rich protein A3-like n=1 Tax=Hibiscus syriacus TaxID=106335 RepID=UPI001922833F|nr:glycine-rich protein A3-like [Hibiscus syriacus]